MSVDDVPGRTRLDRYGGRKVLVRIDTNGEPIEYNENSDYSFRPYFFVQWRGFDDKHKAEYAECTPFSLDITDLPYPLNQSVVDSDRKLSRHKFVMIPYKSVYFLHSDIAKSIGLAPHRFQDRFFPDRIKSVPAAISQPYLVNNSVTTFVEDDRVMAPCRNNLGRISSSDLRKVSVLGKGVELRDSRIPNAGRGVFASRDFRQNELITMYLGHMFGEKQRKHMQEAGVGTHCKPLQLKHSYLDGVKTAFKGMGAGQLVNQGTKATINCDWAYLDVLPGSGERVLGLRATRYIFPGEELYVNYGSKFWDEQQAQPAPPPDVILPSQNGLIPPTNPGNDVLVNTPDMDADTIKSLRDEVAELKRTLTRIESLLDRLDPPLKKKRS